MKKSFCKSYYLENRTTDDDPIRTIVNYGRDVIRNHTKLVSLLSLTVSIDLPAATFNDNWVDLPSTISENDKHTAILNQYKTLSTKNNDKSEE
jgi:hypothetical protein